jgi:hypothetical protein
VEANNEEQEKEFISSGTQSAWNEKRTKKLESILGTDWFKGRKILEVGCGHGDCGRYFANLGSTVTFTDGRRGHLKQLKKDGFETHVMDQDKPWTVDGPFDLIIHWGVSYHLKEWKQDLACAVFRSPIVCFETEVNVGDTEFVRNESPSDYDQSLNGIGVRPTAKMVEEFLDELSATFKRYDDEDLDLGGHEYSWKETDREGWRQGQRRFWMIYYGQQQTNTDDTQNSTGTDS